MRTNRRDFVIKTPARYYKVLDALTKRIESGEKAVSHYIHYGLEDPLQNSFDRRNTALVTLIKPLALEPA